MTNRKKPPLPETNPNMPCNIKSSTRYEVNAYMNGYFPNRMEPAGPTRNPRLAFVFRFLMEKHNFTPEQINEIVKKLNEYEQI